MNPDKFIEIIMEQEGLETQEQVADFLGLKPPSLSGWKDRGSVPKKYLIKYKDQIGVASTVEKSNVEYSKKEKNTMVDCGTYVIGRNEHGQWEKVIKATSVIQVEINGEWVNKKDINHPPPPIN